MKKVVLLFSMLVMTVGLFAQQVISRRDYLAKSQRQNTLGKLFVGAGGAIVVTELIIIKNNSGSTLDPGIVGISPFSVILTFAGLGLMASGIPLFIASGKNKKKAASLSFKKESSPLPLKSSIVCRSFPSLSIKLQL